MGQYLEFVILFSMMVVITLVGLIPTGKQYQGYGSF